MTKIFNWTNSINKKELDQIINILENDGIIIFPTDTVYGIACNGYSEKAIKRIYEIKKRPTNKPICLLTDSLSKIHDMAETTKKEEELIKRYMPGSLTILLNKKDVLPFVLTAGLNTVGIRIPDHEIVLTILKKCPFPLATTSANESGKIETEIEEIIKCFNGKVNAIIKGGTIGSQIASTIIRVENEQIKVIREGSIKFED